MDTSQAQTILTNIGLLDPPSDGALGPITRWALGEFCAAAGVPFDGATISEPVSRALAAAIPIPVAPQNDLAGRIISAMLGKGLFVARHKACLNIVYVEGINLDGTLNGDRPNYFDSVRCLIRIGDGGVPKIVGIWEATTEPSKFWTENPMNSGGAARIAFGQYKSWTMGEYHGHDALIQAADITVYRDPQKLYKRYGAPSTGEFGIHQHHGYNYPKNDEGRSSAGCLVGRLNDGHDEFIALLKTDARYKANPNYRFMTAVLPAEALSGTQNEPIINKVAPPPPPVVASSGDKTFDAYCPEYAADCQNMVILPGKQASIDSVATKLIRHKGRYQAIETQTGVPWYMVAALHQRESDADFTTHLHNGDPLTARTVQVPAGRPRSGNPPFTWEESAIDALTMHGFAEITDWSIERIAYECEKYNGWGYRNHGVPSAYLWSFSNIYKGGKYVADGVWSATTQDQQCGVMPLITRIKALDASVSIPVPPAQPQIVPPPIIVQPPPPPVAPAPTVQPPPVQPPILQPPVAPPSIPQPPLQQPAPSGWGMDTVVADLRERMARLERLLTTVISVAPQAPTTAPVPPPIPTVPTPTPTWTPTPTLPPASQPDLSVLVQQLTAFIQAVKTQSLQLPGGITTGQAQDQLKQLFDLLKAISGGAQQVAKAVQPRLGQVNGALGQTIGDLLNGKKSAIGIIGALATSVLQTVGPDMPLSKIIPVLGSSAGLGSVAMPLFLAISAWGVLGKMEKWSQTQTPTPPPV